LKEKKVISKVTAAIKVPATEICQPPALFVGKPDSVSARWYSLWTGKTPGLQR
jgi:hypothetical protein